MFRTTGNSALLFDFGGTLDADGLPWVDRFFELYAASGGRVGASEFRRVFAETEVALALLPRVDSFDYTRTVAAQAGLLADLLPGDRGLAWEELAGQMTGNAVRAAARNHVLLQALADRQPLGVISNFQGNLEPCLDELGLLDRFDVVVDSARVGVRKPDPAIFRLTLARVGADPDSSWMIGDSPVSDIEPAAALGMRTCWIAPEHRTDRLPTVAPTARLARLTDLPAVLEAACTR